MAGRLSKSDLSGMGDEDRMAVMNMVKEGEITLDEAIAKVKGEAMMKSKGGKRVQAKAALNRRGAMKKYRGRLRLDMQVQKASAFSVVVVQVSEGRDLLPMTKSGTSDPYVKVYLNPDPAKKEKKKTATRKATRNPQFNETFTFEIRSGTNLESVRLVIECWDEHGFLRKKNFMGGMSFSLADLWDDDTPRQGWFKLLDEKMAAFQFKPYIPKRREEAAVLGAKAAGPGPAAPSVSAAVAKADAASKAQTLQPGPTQKLEKRSEKFGGSVHAAAATTRAPMGKVTAANFNFTKVLGQGSFGKVMLAERKGDDDVYAIKIIKKDGVIEDDDVECTMTERRVLALSSGCPFLTRLFATFQTEERLYFVMEFVNGGDLMFHIQNQRVFKPAQAQFYCAEICCGLWYLHGQDIIYRDLKLDNVMLDKDGHIKIADFGMCKEHMSPAATTTTFCGTPGYLAPEIVKELPYGASVDWWSLGVLLYEMLCGDSPFDAEEDDELFEQILTKKLSFPKGVSPVSKSMVEGLMTRDVSRRLGCGNNGKSNIQSHAFFATMDWDKLEKRAVEPPFKPVIKNAKEANNFDEEFTDADPTLTPVDKSVLRGIDQGLFGGFSFVNPDFAAPPGTVPVAAQAEERQGGLRQYPWYRPDLGRMEVGKALKGQAVGSFYLRESSSQPGCFALAVQTGNNKVWHGLVTPTASKTGANKFRLFISKKFDSLPELIEYYCSNPVTSDSSGQPVSLRIPEK